mmetsp:Transcript_9874/g.21509  ORF Transcript_9874/g.21509 Transcript_9874/m.21509 type:complete len:219 (-) Transcript_9874:43-699(-)
MAPRADMARSSSTPPSSCAKKSKLASSMKSIGSTASSHITTPLHIASTHFRMYLPVTSEGSAAWAAMVGITLASLRSIKIFVDWQSLSNASAQATSTSFCRFSRPSAMSFVSRMTSFSVHTSSVKAPRNSKSSESPPRVDFFLAAPVEVDRTGFFGGIVFLPFCLFVRILLVLLMCDLWVCLPWWWLPCLFPCAYVLRGAEKSNGGQHLMKRSLAKQE